MKKKKTKKYKEPPEMRLQRLALAKCMVSKSVPDKKRFNKKRNRQEPIPYFFVQN